jgi:DNA-binding LytR/AlgR family response regulator
MPQHPGIILVIDPDETAARELADLLHRREGPPRCLISSRVRDAESILRSEAVDWLFIRISVWDDYQFLTPNLPQLPRRVVFLSGRNEKCTAHLALAVDGHLQPPYRPGQLAKAWNKLSDPHFVARPLDFFFVKSRARFEPVRYCDIRQVSLQNGRLQVETRYGEYQISGSLLAFQDRVPVPLILARRGWLVNEAFSV